VANHQVARQGRHRNDYIWSMRGRGGGCPTIVEKILEVQHCYWKILLYILNYGHATERGGVCTKKQIIPGIKKKGGFGDSPLKRKKMGTPQKERLFESRVSEA